MDMGAMIKEVVREKSIVGRLWQSYAFGFPFPCSLFCYLRTAKSSQTYRSSALLRMDG